MDIRFIDSRYNELFRIPDGGCIKINLNNGGTLFGKCKYIDDYHFTLTQAGRMYGETYHIRRFAEINERNGNVVEPVEESEYLRESDIRFVEDNMSEFSKDKFFKTDNGVVEVYYNPDADAGGQLVYLEISNDDIRTAAVYRKTGDFFNYIESAAKGYLIDVGTAEFMGNAKSFAERKADFELSTRKTMQELKKYAGAAPKHRDMER